MEVNDQIIYRMNENCQRTVDIIIRTTSNFDYSN